MKLYQRKLSKPIRTLIGWSCVRGKWRIHFLTFIAAILLALVVAAYYFLRSPGAVDFRLHRSRYEAIVAKIKSLGIAPGAFQHVWTNSALDAESLSGHRINNGMVGMIGVSRANSGQYYISIITRDEGHFGTFGYIYSDASYNDSVPGDLPNIKRQIGRHWWIAYNNLW